MPRTKVASLIRLSVQLALGAGVLALPPQSDAVAAEAPPVGAAKTSPCVGVRLELETNTAAAGRPKFIGTLVNDGTDTVTLVEPGDGSDVGWRTPIITWQVATADGTPIPPPALGARCGNVNRIDDSEIFELAPGQRHVLGGWLSEPKAPGGRYLIRLVYENDPSRKRSGIPLGPTSAAASERIANSTPCKVESAPVTVELSGDGLGPLAPGRR